MNSTRVIIGTGFYSDTAFKILKRLEYYTNRFSYYDIPINRAPDNEIIIDYGEYIYTSNPEVINNKRKHIATQFRSMITRVISDFSIKSTSTATFGEINKRYPRTDVYESFTCNVKDLVYIYSKLAQQKRATTYLNEFSDLIGIPNDPIKTALEINRRKKIDTLKKSCDEAIRKLIDEYRDKKQKLDDECGELVNKLEDERDAEIEKLKIP